MVGKCRCCRLTVRLYAWCYPREAITVDLYRILIARKPILTPFLCRPRWLPLLENILQMSSSMQAQMLRTCSGMQRMLPVFPRNSCESIPFLVYCPQIGNNLRAIDKPSDPYYRIRVAYASVLKIGRASCRERV